MSTHVGKEAGSQRFGFIRTRHSELKGPIQQLAQPAITPDKLAHAGTVQIPLAFLTFGSNMPPPNSLQRAKKKKKSQTKDKPPQNQTKRHPPPNLCWLGLLTWF